MRHLQDDSFFFYSKLTLSSDGIICKCDSRINAQRPRCEVNCSKETGRRVPPTTTHSQSKPSTLYSSQCLQMTFSYHFHILMKWNK